MLLQNPRSLIWRIFRINVSIRSRSSFLPTKRIKNLEKVYDDFVCGAKNLRFRVKRYVRMPTSVFQTNTGKSPCGTRRLETKNIPKMTMIFDMMNSLQNDYYHPIKKLLLS
ncbi:uncharacterized protein LOC131654925 [Vicia villosa]|uniref:uncharacterized protein LOC131654925 n=1 Tax=Vicia villosa TaxID=3911 RepID=UPI00273B8505|nr:uncharacterized protein LOC131654925 [Vicia villosa]